MPDVVTYVYWGIGMLVAGPLLARGFTAFDDGRLPGGFGYLFFSSAAIGLAATAWFATEDASLLARNLTLRLIGSVAGASGLIWCGYVVHGAVKNDPATATSPPAPTNGSGATINFSGTNSGVVTTGDIGTVNINQDPRNWGFSPGQAEKFRLALSSSTVRGRVLIRLNDSMSRKFKDQLVQILSSVPGWEAYYQGEHPNTLGDIRGVTIDYHDVDPHPLAEVLIAAFASTGLMPPAGHVPVQVWKNGEVRVVIGSPPG